MGGPSSEILLATRWAEQLALVGRCCFLLLRAFGAANVSPPFFACAVRHVAVVDCVPRNPIGILLHITVDVDCHCSRLLLNGGYWYIESLRPIGEVAGWGGNADVTSSVHNIRQGGGWLRFSPKLLLEW